MSLEYQIIPHQIGFLGIEPGSRIYRTSLQNGRYVESRDVTLPGYWTQFGTEPVWLTEETMMAPGSTDSRVYIIHRPNGQKLQVTVVPNLYGDGYSRSIVGVDVLYEINRASITTSAPSFYPHK